VNGSLQKLNCFHAFREPILTRKEVKWYGVFTPYKDWGKPRPGDVPAGAHISFAFLPDGK
jgi:hypothetical protein